MSELGTRREHAYASEHHSHPAPNGMATAALVLGIVGLILSMIPFTFFIGVILDILAVVFGAVAKSHMRKWPRDFINPGSATAGIVTGIIGLLFILIWIGVIISSSGSGFEINING